MTLKELKASFHEQSKLVYNENLGLKTEEELIDYKNELIKRNNEIIKYIRVNFYKVQNVIPVQV